MDELTLYTGHSRRELTNDIKEKESILKYLVKKQINNVDAVGKIVADYYVKPDEVLKMMRRG